jgi:hypothetical protein
MHPIKPRGTVGVPRPYVFEYFDEDAERNWVTGALPTVGYIHAELCTGCQRVRWYGVPATINEDTEERSHLPIPATSPQQAPETLPLPASGPASEEESES